MPANAIYVGTSIRIRSVLTDVDTGAPVVPSDVTYRAFREDGTTFGTFTLSGAQVTQIIPGTYEVRFAPDVPGTWTWEGEGANGQGVDSGLFVVRAKPA